MKKYIIRRILLMIPLVFGVTTATFALIHMIPGDAVELLASDSRQLTEVEKERIAESLGLNDPLPVQYIRYMTNLLKGDMGRSIASRSPVSYEIGQRLPDVPAAMIALEAGDIDWWGAVTPGDDVGRFQDNEDMTVINFGCPVATRLYMSVNQAPFDDVRFRKALSHMKDGEAINAALRGPTHVKGAGTAGPGVAGYVEGLYDEFHAYDLDLAMSLLDEIGIVDSDGDGLREWEGENMVIPMHSWNSDPAPDYVAAMVDAGVQVGLTIDPQITDGGTNNAKRLAGEWGIYLGQGWCGEGGTNSLWGRNGWISSLGYEDEEVFSLLDLAASNINEEEREGQLQAATRRIAALYWEPAFSFFNIFTVKNNYVKDFFGGEWTLNIVTDDHNVWIAEDQR